MGFSLRYSSFESASDATPTWLNPMRYVCCPVSVSKQNPDRRTITLKLPSYVVCTDGSKCMDRAILAFQLLRYGTANQVNPVV